MTKKSPLTKVEKFYIEHNAELGKKALSEELNRTQKSVQSHIDSVKPKSRHSVESKSDSAPTTRTGVLMARNEKGSTTMTEAASQASDESKGKVKGLGARYTGAVTTIKNQ
jgi:hypothetical protein